MKIRSKALYAYFRQAGVLDGRPEDIAMAKLEYRRLYKKQWKTLKRPRKEIRIIFTLKQFEEIKHHAVLVGLRPTPYARKAILESVEKDFRPLNDECLSRSLQLVSMVAISLSRQPDNPQAAMEMVTEAETLLISLVKKQLITRT